MNKKQVLYAGIISGGLGVAIGAFGAHALKPLLIENGRLETFELAVRYQFYHAFALLATGILMSQFISKRFRYAAMFFIGGIMFFSGSLYALCITNIGILGAVTPVGGVLFILGWVWLLLAIRE